MKRFSTFFFILTLSWAEVNLFTQRLSLDGVFWGNARAYQEWTRGWLKSGFEFQQLGGFLALNGKLSERASTRVEVDVGKIILRDLFLDFHWQNGIGLRAGQFKLPLSFESELSEDKLRFVDYSILHNSELVKLGELRDIGMMASYTIQSEEIEWFRAMALVVNGAGPNSSDNNSRKDVAGRVIISPWKNLNLKLACRGYYGWFESWGIGWSCVAGEVSYEQKHFSVQTEALYRRYQNKAVPAGYCQVMSDLGGVLPAVRLELARWENDDIEWCVTSGIELTPIPERVKVILNYQYHNFVAARRAQEIVVKLVFGF
ncbi:MAG: porin [candidate division WOR-3 bacterium]